MKGKAFNRKMDTLKSELLSGKQNPEQEKDYRKYFEIKETPKGEIALTFTLLMNGTASSS